MKKLFKNSYIALAVLALGFSACTEEVDYTPAQAPTNEQVYFSNTNGAKIDIAKEAKSFDIAVSRAEAGAAASVAVAVTADSAATAVFDFPATVEFADSAASAVYTVKVKEGVELEYAVYHNITLAFDEAITTPYGNAAYSFSVGVPAPWSEWAQVGTGTFYLSVYWSGTHSALPIYYREYLLNDTDAEFFIPGIANSMDLTIQYNRKSGACQVLPQYALTNSNYGQVTVSDLPHYPLQPGLTYEGFPCTYDAEKGLFELNLVYFVCTDYNANTNGMFGNGVETFQLDGFKQYDYSMSLAFKGHYVDGSGIDHAVISAVKGADVAQYLMTVVSTEDDPQAVLAGMLDGSVPCDTLTESGFYAYPLAESGVYAAVAVAFDAEGTAMTGEAEEFEFFAVGEENPWQTLGVAAYTDDLMTSFMKEPVNNTYGVEVRENQDTPGLYRIIDPYAPFGADTTTEYYIEIDATDPEGVWITGPYEIGLDIGLGQMSVTSMAYYQVATTEGATKEDAKAAGLCGIMADGVITFPVKGLLTMMGTDAYYGNVNGAFMLDLNNIQPMEAAPAKVNAVRGKASMELNEENAEGFSSVVKFKKIDSSFQTIKGIEVAE